MNFADGRSSKCDYGSLTSEFNNPYAQWNDSKAADAWVEAEKAYSDQQNPPPLGCTSCYSSYSLLTVR